jgi:hypothetical protein
MWQLIPTETHRVWLFRSILSMENITLIAARMRIPLYTFNHFYHSRRSGLIYNTTKYTANLLLSDITICIGIAMAANNRPFILQLPDELLQRIFIGVLDDLTNPTYTASASVCRTFHRMFSELLYQSFVDIDETHPRIANQKVREIADRLRRPENALLIKSLLVMTKGFLREYSVIPVLKLMDSLSILAIAGPSGQTRADFMEVFMASARRSPGSKGTLASLDQCEYSIFNLGEAD